MKIILALLGLVICFNLKAQNTDDAFRFDTIYNPTPQSISRDSNRTANNKNGQTDISLVKTANSIESDARTASRAKRGHWEVGGNFGLGFGNYTNINISPQIGYRFDKFAVGGGFNYNYFEHHRTDRTINYFGMNLYARAYPMQYAVLYVQPEVQRRWGTIRGFKDESEILPCLLIGAGTHIPLAFRGSVIISLYYDVIQNDYTPYGSSVGYSIGYSYSF